MLRGRPTLVFLTLFVAVPAIAFAAVDPKQQTTKDSCVAGYAYEFVPTGKGVNIREKRVVNCEARDAYGNFLNKQDPHCRFAYADVYWGCRGDAQTGEIKCGHRACAEGRSISSVTFSSLRGGGTLLEPVDAAALKGGTVIASLPLGTAADYLAPAYVQSVQAGELPTQTQTQDTGTGGQLSNPQQEGAAPAAGTRYASLSVSQTDSVFLTPGSAPPEGDAAVQKNGETAQTGTVVAEQTFAASSGAGGTQAVGGTPEQIIERVITQKKQELDAARADLQARTDTYTAAVKATGQTDVIKDESWPLYQQWWREYQNRVDAFNKNVEAYRAGDPTITKALGEAANINTGGASVWVDDTTARMRQSSDSAWNKTPSFWDDPFAATAGGVRRLGEQVSVLTLEAVRNTGERAGTFGEFLGFNDPQRAVGRVLDPVGETNQFAQDNAVIAGVTVAPWAAGRVMGFINSFPRTQAAQDMSELPVMSSEPTAPATAPTPAPEAVAPAVASERSALQALLRELEGQGPAAPAAAPSTAAREPEAFFGPWGSQLKITPEDIAGHTLTQPGTPPPILTDELKWTIVKSAATPLNITEADAVNQGGGSPPVPSPGLPQSEDQTPGVTVAPKQSEEFKMPVDVITKDEFDKILGKSSKSESEKQTVPPPPPVVAQEPSSAPQLTEPQKKDQIPKVDAPIPDAPKPPQGAQSEPQEEQKKQEQQPQQPALKQDNAVLTSPTGSEVVPKQNDASSQQKQSDQKQSAVKTDNNPYVDWSQMPTQQDGEPQKDFLKRRAEWVQKQIDAMPPIPSAQKDESLEDYERRLDEHYWTGKRLHDQLHNDMSSPYADDLISWYRGKPIKCDSCHVPGSSGMASVDVYGGIGIRVQIERKEFAGVTYPGGTITSVFYADTPAAKAGLQKGDFIINVDDGRGTIYNHIYSSLFAGIMGKPMTPVTLTYIPVGQTQPQTVTIIRGNIFCRSYGCP